MTTNSERIYTSKIIKAGALLADTKTLLIHWNEKLSTEENLKRFQEENIFGKTSRSRIEDMLRIFRQRYLHDLSVINALTTLVKNQCPSDALHRIFYFHSAQADPLLHDTVTNILYPLHEQGRIEISVEDIQRVASQWVSEGKTAGAWSEPTTLRICRGLAATLRDFGILQGKVKKRLTPIYLPVESFAYIAFYLKRDQPSGERLLNHPEWQLFFLSRDGVERLFIEAHQHHLLEYQAAGSVIRITFPTDSFEEYTGFLTQK